MTKSNEESKKIWEEFLKKEYIEHLEYTPKVVEDTEYYAVVIEPRNHPDLLTVIKSTMFHLNETNSSIKWGLQIFHGNKNEDMINNIKSSMDNVISTNIGVDGFTHQEHSDYMETNNFWDRVRGKKVLIFQSDSLLIRDGIDDFLEYDYVGAPWRKPKENQWVGNGGLSLRSVSVMKKICKENKPTEPILEDIFFIKYLQGKGVADIETAKKFSMEDVYSENPLGVHNPIRHIEPNLLKSVLFKM